MAEFEQMMRTIGLAAAGLFALLLLARGYWLLRTRGSRTAIMVLPRWRLLLALAWTLALSGLAAGLLAQVFVLQRGSVFMPDAVKLLLACGLLAWVALEAWMRWWPRRVIGRMGLVASVVLALLVAGFAALLLLRYAAARQYPPLDEGVVLALPFQGEWAAIGAGATAMTNHHHRIASQRFAMDLARLCEDGRLYRGAGRTNAESCTFGAMIVSPVDGIVSHAVDGLADSDSRKALAGNHVIIGFTPGRYVALAHLQQGSVRVRAGERVQIGHEIGLAGNSGNTDFSHLHIHVQDTPVYDIRRSRSIPFRFDHIERRRWLRWVPVGDAEILGNDRLRPDGG